MTCLYCQKATFARQMCCAHYTRWLRYGDPHLVRIAPDGAALNFLKDLVGHTGKGCVLWPFRAQYRQKYGSLWFEGRLTGAHRLMCRMAHGEPNGMEAAHSCHTRLCVNPNHLRWATRAENLAERRLLKGESNPSAKLSASDVRKMREMIGLKMSHGSIANEFGVSRRNVTRIAAGETWREQA